MNKLIVIGFFILFSLLARAEIQIQIDPPQVNVGEPFRVVLSQSNLQSGGGIPDLTPLRKNFVILGTERSVNYTIINGQTQSSSTWIVSLKAHKSGILTIPPIKIGAEESRSLTINITDGSNQQNTSSNDLDNPQQQQGIILTTEVNEKKPYVNQQIIYKVTLYNSKQLLDANYQGPKVENALLIPLGGEKHYQTQKNNVQYLVEEQNYAVFPQKSGPLKITSPVFTALVYDFDPQRIKARDKPIILEVQPTPKEYKGKIWLPAKQVKLTEEYENAGQTLSQGNTLVRTVTLEGVGIPAQLLPTLNFKETGAFSVYPEKGKDKNQIVQGEIISSTQIKVTYLFNKSGKITIPELKLPWFNTETGHEEIATLAPRIIDVTQSTSSGVTPKVDQPQKETVVPESQEPSLQTAPLQNYWGWIVALFFALAWIITLILWRWQKRQKNLGKGAYKKALKELHEACMQGNPERTRNALLIWANLHWPDAAILNLAGLARLTTAEHLKKHVHILSRVLYKGTEKTLWHGDELWRSVNEIKQINTKHQNVRNHLPPMNPS